MVTAKNKSLLPHLCWPTTVKPDYLSLRSVIGNSKMTSLYQQDPIRSEGQLMKLFFQVVILLTTGQAVGVMLQHCQNIIQNHSDELN